MFYASWVRVDLAHLDHPIVDQDRATLGDLGGFVQVGGLDDKVAADALLRLGVGSIDDRLPPPYAHNLAPRFQLVAAVVAALAAQLLRPLDVALDDLLVLLGRVVAGRVVSAAD